MAIINPKDCTLLTVITLLITVLVCNVKSDTPKICPNFCKCDLYNERNRADCSAKRLISPNLEISAAVELLDLSYNDITNLDNNCFQNYNYLINLNISHNAIHTIDLDAFRRLRRLNAIDLSYNRLEDLDERLFETNRHLLKLNLEGNKFMSLLQKPLLRSKSLQTLNLRNSQINFIGPELLSALPQLQQLDLSHNLMITIDLNAFNALPKLRQLNLQSNRWVCDQALMASVKMLQQRGAEVTLADCNVKKELKNEIDVPKFERMKMMPPEETRLTDFSMEGLESNDSSERSVTEENNYQTESTIVWNKWRVPEYSKDDDEQNYDDNEYDSLSNDRYPMSPIRITPDGYICEGSKKLLCLLYGNCLQKLMDTIKKDDKANKSSLYTKSDLNFAFLLGCAAGISVVVLVVSCAMCFKSCYEEKRRIRVHLEDTYTPVTSVAPRRPQIHRLPAPQPPSQPTVPAARSRRSRRSRHSAQASSDYSSRAVVSHDPTNDNFFSRLFGRPSRHQYYRTINQNTATLIRRLSRSNLFNNRLSQHFAERQRNGGGDASSPSPSPVDPHSNQFDYEIASERINVVPRPETPPPNYGDVVANKC